MIYESKIDFNLRFWRQNIFDATFFFSTDNNVVRQSNLDL